MGLLGKLNPLKIVGNLLGLREPDHAKRARNSATDEARALREETGRAAAKKEALTAERRKKGEKIRITGMRARSSSRKSTLGGEKDSLGASKTTLG